MLYLPNGEALQYLTLGFDQAFSQVLWFQTVQYFARQLQSERNYRWLFHMCDLVTTLNPRALHVYEFAGIMLAWEAKDPELALAMLGKGIDANPEYWRLYYYRGMLRLHFLEDHEGAKDDLLLGAKLPEAPPFMAKLAALQLSNATSAELAVNFLEDMLRATPEGPARKGLERALLEAHHRRDAKRLEELVARVEQERGIRISSLEELIPLGVLRAVPSDPWGGRFELNPNTRKVRGSKMPAAEAASDDEGGAGRTDRSGAATP